MIDLKSQKTCIFGTQGSGKTHWARTFYKQFKYPIVYQINDDDSWSSLPRILVWKADRKNIRSDFAKFVKKAYEWAQEGKVDCIIIDEADMFFQNNWELTPEMTDLVLNHRHIPANKGTALWFITRRPQDIPTKIVETSKYLIIFKLEGANAIQRFKEIHPQIPEMIQKLQYEKHNYVFKEIGKDPIVHKPI